jgi:hypothetical protein
MHNIDLREQGLFSDLSPGNAFKNNGSLLLKQYFNSKMEQHMIIFYMTGRFPQKTVFQAMEKDPELQESTARLGYISSS